MIEMKEALSGVGASDQSQANESSTTQNYTMPEEMGQIFVLINQCNSIIPKEEKGIGYFFEINRYGISLKYHYVSAVDGDSSMVTFIDEDFESPVQMAEILQRVLFALRNILVMKRAGL